MCQPILSTSDKIIDEKSCIFLKLIFVHLDSKIFHLKYLLDVVKYFGVSYIPMTLFVIAIG